MKEAFKTWLKSLNPYVRDTYRRLWEESPRDSCPMLTPNNASGFGSWVAFVAARLRRFSVQNRKLSFNLKSNQLPSIQNLRSKIASVRRSSQFWPPPMQSRKPSLASAAASRTAASQESAPLAPIDGQGRSFAIYITSRSISSLTTARLCAAKASFNSKRLSHRCSAPPFPARRLPGPDPIPCSGSTPA